MRPARSLPRRTVLAGGLAALLAWAGAARAQGKEQVDLPRFPGFHVDDSKYHDFAEFRFANAAWLEDPDTGGDLREGRYWWVDYVLDDDARQPTALELIRNHEQLVRQTGGALVFRSPRNGLYEHAVYRWPTAQGGERWLQLDVQHTGVRYQVHVLEVAGMTQKLELSAVQMADALRRDGQVMLRGILFDTGKADIRAESAPLLAEIVTLLQQDRGLRLLVEGHTDNVGSAAGNLALSRRRAQAVVRWLVDRGIAAERLQAEGRGDTRPVADNRTEAGRAQNRRVVLVRR
jgi:OOP family OmpA-OmpF porin